MIYLSSISINTKGSENMKTTGMVRKFDSLGRVVVPAEIRHTLGYKDGDLMEILIEGDYVVLRKFQSSCIFCTNDNAEELHEFMGKKICTNCLKKMQNMI